MPPKKRFRLTRKKGSSKGKKAPKCHGGDGSNSISNSKAVKKALNVTYSRENRNSFLEKKKTESTTEIQIYYFDNQQVDCDQFDQS